MGSAVPLGPYVDKDGVDMMNGGGSLFLETEDYMIGPGHFADYEKDLNQFFSFHYYDRRRGGNSWIAERELIFENGWPKAGELISSYSGDFGDSGNLGDSEEDCRNSQFTNILAKIFLPWW